MSQKTELQSNNTDLQTVLSKVNALPSGAALGDATAADVLAGKTFSSASGIKVAGAMNKGPEILVGTFNSSGNTSVTVPEIIGKTNIFAVMTNPVNQSSRYCGAFALVDGVSSTFVMGQGVNGTVTLTTTTGKITVSATNCSGINYGDWRYIAW